jgi:iron(III) transport system substrate-binding protein
VTNKIVSAAVALLAITVASCGTASSPSGSTASQTPAQASGSVLPATQNRREALTAAAKDEGSVTWYTTDPPAAVNRIVKGFSTRYGIKVDYVRAASNELTQRYSAEAQAGKVQADVIDGPASAFYSDAMQKGWTTPLKTAGIPTLDDGEFPKQFYREDQGIAIDIVITWLMGYNTRQVSADKAPKTWDDMLKPEFNNRIILVDPRASDAHVEFWDRIMLARGEDFLTRFKAQSPRLAAGGPAAVEALAAGEGAIVLPAAGANITASKANGAPVEMVQPELTVGIESGVALSRNAAHPNAGRLFIDYLLSREGNAVANEDPGSHSPYGADFPKEYHSPRKEALGNKAKIFQLLGVG